MISKAGLLDRLITCTGMLHCRLTDKMRAVLTTEQQQGLVTEAALPGAADALQLGIGRRGLRLIVVIPLAVSGLLEATRACCGLCMTTPLLHART